MNKPTMDLYRNERIEIFLSGLLTAGTVSLVYLILYLLINTIARTPFANNAFITEFRIWLFNGNYNVLLDILTFSYVIVLFTTIIWQTRRRIQRAKLNHILDYVEYMGEGNFDLRIPAEEAGRYESVAWNINELMDSIEESIRKQQESERTKDELITNVGHDIRTPLTSVLGYLKLLEGQKNLSEEEKESYIHVAYSKAKAMEVLVNDLFDYTRSMSSAMKLNVFDTVEIEPFFDQIISEFQLTAEKKKIELVAQVTPEHLTGCFDPEKMARVFGNLVINGIKYGKGATHISLTAQYMPHTSYITHYGQHINEQVNHKYSQIDGWLVCQVRNNGELLDQSELESIYERSYRGDSSRTSSEPGSGLGLSIVRNIVNLHGGSTYASIDMNELVFHVDLPQGQEKHQS